MKKFKQLVEEMNLYKELQETESKKYKVTMEMIRGHIYDISKST